MNAEFANGLLVFTQFVLIKSPDNSKTVLLSESFFNLEFDSDFDELDDLDDLDDDDGESTVYAYFVFVPVGI